MKVHRLGKGANLLKYRLFTYAVLKATSEHTGDHIQLFHVGCEELRRLSGEGGDVNNGALQDGSLGIKFVGVMDGRCQAY